MNLYKAQNKSGDVFYTVAADYGEVAPKIKAWLDKRKIERKI